MSNNNTRKDEQENVFQEIKTSDIKTKKEEGNKKENTNEKNNTEESKNTEKNENSKEKELKEENEKLKETLMRTLAELENTRRRSIEENEKTAKYAIGKFAEDLIPVMEDFYLAFKNSENNENCDKEGCKIFFDGIKLTQNELKKVFEKHGLVRLFPINETFNPELHNAISQIESDKDEGIIVDVMQAGYTIKGRILRPALVIVSKGKK